MLALRAHHRLAHDHISAGKRLVGAEAEVDLVGEGDGERIPLDRALVPAALRLDRGQRA